MINHHNSELIELWYHQYADFLFKYACQFVDYHSAQEIVQESFRVVCEKGDLEQIEYPKTWLRKITSNVLRNWLRDRKNWKELLVEIEKVPEVKNSLHMDEINVELEYSGFIKSEDLHLLTLLTSGYTYVEAAKEFGITADACRKRAIRAAEQLKKKLKKSCM